MGLYLILPGDRWGKVIRKGETVRNGNTCIPVFDIKDDVFEGCVPKVAKDIMGLERDVLLLEIVNPPDIAYYPIKRKDDYNILGLVQNFVPASDMKLVFAFDVTGGALCTIRDEKQWHEEWEQKNDAILRGKVLWTAEEWVEIFKIQETFDPKNLINEQRLYFIERYGKMTGLSHHLRYGKIQQFLVEHKEQLEQAGLMVMGANKGLALRAVLKVLCGMEHNHDTGRKGLGRYTFSYDEFIKKFYEIPEEERKTKA
ncbi:MAG: hypothetical protein A2268_01010 [Candidatus Raymondbacteria bacterium RifOxyA12_full_50_37]|uniref:Uncharacterized protein n=1 Tax=Candidatus Raymondbacteria bacterium RIFOXYD12_FULL_49_13 TaxID=1817890 RepID=A0A1F7FFW4_UNCRA|nr:MAG: hypothetical protein A2268_01010 [Candidatus Raymondbacteria bacterium RifOxyA12_full_50_37]OGJ86382.1 MAG: hypothetical protein A2248_13975 [Candidatus Raymondbacteria bacterium RIFOXYA2_FULL_49_16]OGJ95552.1 MAG: hypothetical protein A2453_12750 [Candidatus Raymondbacteria bacterium RIFOXYC2_FULL_50_21]OGJ99449.1 MAG: hypothetical protein A2487_07505 [Candidatus Raymondbacteria bacterium RifOxyC12_full_50_8]OGK05513.1 MAG: hypothetical protein A2519_05335 [Candidatus Raymondbacteria b